MKPDFHWGLIHMLLPRLAQTIARPRIALWMARHSHTPLRLIVGPVGSGKTTAVATFLRQRGLQFAYFAVTPQHSTGDLGADLAAAFGFGAPGGFDELKDALAACGQIQIAVENIDAAAPPLRDWLARLIEECGENVTFIYTARGWNALDVARLSAHGLAAVCDDRMLAFDPDETAALAEKLGVAHTPLEAQELSEATEGWPIVVSGAIREAFEHGRPLANAYAFWRKARSYPFRQFIEASVESVDAAALEAWDQFVAHGKLDSQSGAGQLRRAGLPVRRDLHGNHFAYRVIEELFGAQPAVASVPVQKSQPLVVRVLGEFSATLGREQITWIRRRDQQIFLYLLLKESGSATRLELCERFWPDAEPELRSASLRVACSNIRRALGNRCGNQHVDRYFRSDGDIAVNFEQISLDARRFRRHVSDGDEHFSRGNHQEALAHYRMAEALYGGRIGWCSNAEDWLNVHADLYESLYDGVLERLVALHRRSEDAGSVTEYMTAASAKRQARSDVAATRAC